MNWGEIRLRILACLVAYLIIFTNAVAVAENESEIQIFKTNTDVFVPEQQVFTDAVAVGSNITILDEARITNDTVAIGEEIIR